MRESKCAHLSKEVIKQYMIVYFLSIPHLNPAYLNQLNIVGTFIDIWRVLSFGFIVGLYFWKRKMPSKIAICIEIMLIYIWTLTVIFGGAVLQYSKTVFAITSIVLLYDYFLEYNPKVFVSVQLLCFEIIIYINLLTEIIFPDGLFLSVSDTNNFSSWKNWFLGFYNMHTQYFIPALMLAYLYADITNKWVRAYLLTFIIWISALLVWSGGVLLSLVSMTIVYILFKKRTRLFNYYNYWIMQIGFFIFIICLKFQNVFGWLIDGILHKGDSLKGRMQLWDKTLTLISNNLIWGQGYKIPKVREMEVGMSWASHAHNLVLEVLYRGGFIYMAMFIVCIIICGKELMKYKHVKAGQIISCAFLGWCVHLLVDYFDSGFLMSMFVVGYSWNSVLQKEDGLTKRKDG